MPLGSCPSRFHLRLLQTLPTLTQTFLTFTDLPTSADLLTSFTSLRKGRSSLKKGHTFLNFLQLQRHLCLFFLFFHSEISLFPFINLFTSAPPSSPPEALLGRFPGNLPDPAIEPTSPTLARRFFITEPPGKPTSVLYWLKNLYLQPLNSATSLRLTQINVISDICFRLSKTIINTLIMLTLYQLFKNSSFK